MVELNFIYYILAVIVLIMLLMYIVLRYKYKKFKDAYYSLNRLCLHKSNQISMIEYQYRNYKEGKNAFTTLRDIGIILEMENNIGGNYGK